MCWGLPVYDKLTKVWEPTKMPTLRLEKKYCIFCGGIICGIEQRRNGPCLSFGEVVLIEATSFLKKQARRKHCDKVNAACHMLAHLKEHAHVRYLRLHPSALKCDFLTPRPGGPAYFVLSRNTITAFSHDHSLSLLCNKLSKDFCLKTRTFSFLYSALSLKSSEIFIAPGT